MHLGSLASCVHSSPELLRLISRCYVQITLLQNKGVYEIGCASVAYILVLLNPRSYVHGLHCRTSHIVMLLAALNGASPSAVKIEVLRPVPSQGFSMVGAGVYRLHHGKTTRLESPSIATTMFKYLGSYAVPLRVPHSITSPC